MTDQKSSTAVATVPEPSAVTVVTPPAVNLDNWPANRFNRLIPTQTLQLPSDLFTFQMNVVQLDLDRDTYESPDVPKGNRALSRSGLRKLSTVAGISVIDQRRTDDGTNPNVSEVTTTGEMLLPTGQRIRAVGMKRIDIGAQRWASDNQRAKFKSFFQEHVASRSEHRMIRSILSLQASYPIAELRKPFAVVSIVPNYNHPAVQARMIENMAPAITAGYGPEPVKQIAPGDLQILPPAPDDDVVEGQITTESTPSAASTSDGAAAAEPSWFDALPTTKPADGSPSKLVEVLREKAAKSGMVGDITDPQKGPVAAAFGNEIALELIAAGLHETFGTELATDAHGKPKLRLTAAQAQAIIEAAKDDDFRLLWREAFGEAAAA